MCRKFTCILKNMLKAAAFMSTLAGLAAAIVELRDSSQRKGDEAAHEPYGLYEKYIKRPLDCAVATMAVLLGWPLYLTVAVLVRKRLGAPVIFSQDRPGREKKIFRLYKFRTMTDERDETGELLPDDRRLTDFGALLRKTSLDEIPELLNIIKGDMSLVGPRPLLVNYLPWYRGRECTRHDVRPGLTGLAQVNGRNNLPWDERLSLDADYVERITFLGDLEILIQTVKKILKKEDIQVATDQEGNLAEMRSMEQS